MSETPKPLPPPAASSDEPYLAAPPFPQPPDFMVPAVPEQTAITEVPPPFDSRAVVRVSFNPEEEVRKRLLAKGGQELLEAFIATQSKVKGIDASFANKRATAMSIYDYYYDHEKVWHFRVDRNSIHTNRETVKGKSFVMTFDEDGRLVHSVEFFQTKVPWYKALWKRLTYVFGVK